MDPEIKTFVGLAVLGVSLIAILPVLPFILFFWWWFGGFDGRERFAGSLH
jgi:hypothetical protein